VEIALGPKGAFMNGNIGSLRRKVPASQVVSAVPESQRQLKRPREPRTPRVVELLRKAMEWQELLDSGKASSQAEIARSEDLTRARVTQVLSLLRLAPEIQEYILSMPEVVVRPAITERALRPIVQLKQAGTQLEAFEQLVDQR